MKTIRIGSETRQWTGAVFGGSGRAATAPPPSAAQGRRKSFVSFGIGHASGARCAGRQSRSATLSTSARPGFTLIELLVVISIMALLAAFTIVALSGIAKTKYQSVARSEMTQIEAALEAYKAQYGVYPPSNANPASSYPVPASPLSPALYPQLYYELCGVYPTNYHNSAYFVTLDNSAWIAPKEVLTAFGVNGFINCTRGTGEDVTPAKNFLQSLKQNRIGSVTVGSVSFSNLVTSVSGPSATYMPLVAPNPYNPFRYLYPGTNNPAKYDLWVQLNISGTKYLICNWSASAPRNDPAP
jgi:prepilin-type N-terminal cleavage/methylation domain-containing protein